MKTPHPFVALLLAGTVLTSSCSSTTVLQTNPVGAKLYLDGESVGTTPYRHTDTKIVGSTTSVRLEKEGYEPLDTYFSRDEEADVGAIVGGVFFLFPFLWTMKYKPTRTYEMKPLGTTEPAQPLPIAAQPAAQATGKSKADRLRETKKLLDDKILTQQEYEAEKQKILSE